MDRKSPSSNRLHILNSIQRDTDSEGDTQEGLDPEGTRGEESPLIPLSSYHSIIDMRKVVDSCFVVVCLLTISNTDYANFGPLDGLVFICMGIAALSCITLAIVRKKKGGSHG